MTRLGGRLLLVRRGLAQHAVSTAVTIGSVALATGLVMALFAVSAAARRAFTGGEIGFDAVLGARGSPLQLVLNAVFHLETSPGNLPWAEYERVRADPRVTLAVPYAVGDSYRGFRVVGTTSELFTGTGLHRVAPGGRLFDERRREAVLGSVAAEATGLRVGDPFEPAHGVGQEDGHSHEVEFVVVGVLEPTGSPADRVVWIPIEGVFRMPRHVLRGAGEVYEAKPGEPIPDEHKEVSAVLLRLTDASAGLQLAQELNREGRDATLAYPVAASVLELFDRLGWALLLLAFVAYAAVAVAAASILASLWEAMDRRRREFAILRALGARRRTVFGVIVAESVAIALLGSALGYGLLVVLLALAASVLRTRTGVVLDPWTLHPALLWTPLVMAVLGAVAGCLPAWRAYATDVAESLGATA